MANVSPRASATLGSFNASPAQDAERTALACCASRTFAKAVADGVGKSFLNSGQTCSALTRMLVPRARMEQAEQTAAAAAENV